MAYGLPAHGDPNWDTKLNDSIGAVKVTADAAQPAASLEADVATKVGTAGALDTALSASIDQRRVTYHPATYGAVGDGVTDDSAAMNNMTAAIVAAGGRGVIQLDGSKVYLVADWGFATSGIVDVRVDGRGATIKARATPTVVSVRIGATSAVGRLKWVDCTFDDNVTGRPGGSESKVFLSMEKFDYLGFFRCRFTNLNYHQLSSHTTIAGEGVVVIDECTFDGAGGVGTAAQIYMSSLAKWTITRTRFSNCGNTGVNGAIQGIYGGGCAELRMSGCVFDNCGQAWDLRAVAARVKITACTIIGGPNGSGNTSGAGNVTSTADDAVMENITIIGSQHPQVVRLSGGNRNRLSGWIYRADASAPVGQRFARVAGAGHKVQAPDLVCQTATSTTAAVFDLADQPTDFEVVGGVIEGGVRLFRVLAAQATVAARTAGLVTRGQANYWVNEVGATGDSPLAMIVRGTTQHATDNARLLIEGDTGLRDITALMPGAVTTSNPNMKLYVRRVGKRVTFSLRETVAGTGTGTLTLLSASTATLALGAGFTPYPTAMSVPGPVFSDSSGLPIANASLYLGTAPFLRLFGATTVLQRAEISYVTNDDWPTILPGTAA